MAREKKLRKKIVDDFATLYGLPRRLMVVGLVLKTIANPGVRSPTAHAHRC